METTATSINKIPEDSQDTTAVPRLRVSTVSSTLRRANTTLNLNSPTRSKGSTTNTLSKDLIPSRAACTINSKVHTRNKVDMATGGVAQRTAAPV